jgi:hypothetical protein
MIAFFQRKPSMSPTQKLLFWQQHIRAWQSSHVSQSAYCRTHQLSRANFAYWRKRLAPVTRSVPAMIPVMRESLATGIQLRSPGGWVITVPSSASMESLRTVVAVLP